ncbi:MAG: hypothetical protein JXO22_16375, partial [Phycisphaerae bacterium]|nr:hypothetical protein [Phycisphaerae bacterium]
IMRMHLHQRSDYWFDNETEQASLLSLNRYLPSNVITTALNRLDDYSFHSALPSSLCLGWIADAPDFDMETARRLTDTYRDVRHLLVGACYPLLQYSRDSTLWLASQYHRPDLDEGLIIVLRHPQSPYCAVLLRCRGLDPDARYELRSMPDGEVRVVVGRELLNGLQVALPNSRDSRLITYKRAK